MAPPDQLLQPLGWLALAMAALGLILALGRRIGTALQLRLWGIPEALVAGLLGLLLAPSGPLPLLPQPVMQLWADLPLVLLTLVFGSLLLGKPLPQLKALWRPVTGQVSLALMLAFGQYVVGGLAVLLVLQPLLGVSPIMACLIEVAYEGGHGSAAAMGPSYAALGFPGGQDLGLAMATVGLLSSTLVGGLVVVLAANGVFRASVAALRFGAAALGLKPFGEYAYLLFCAGLLNASLFAACILPLSTAYTVCEGLGFESGVNKQWGEAPVFYWLFTLLIVIGGGVILIPNFPLVRMILLSQVLNGVLLPFVLIYMTIIVNRKAIMRDWTNSRAYNAVAWAAVAIMIGLTVALVGISLRDISG